MDTNETKTVPQLIDESRLLDDSLMTLVFDGNKEAAQLVLNIILERNDLEVKMVTTQKEAHSPLFNGRNVKVDIFAEDTDGNKFDVEVQRSDEGAGFTRARFLSAVLDHGMLKKSQKFKEIKDSYVIFITERDVLKGNLPLYHIERGIVELKKLVNDGNHIIYANGAYHDNTTPIGRLMHDFRCRDPKDMFYDILKKSVQQFKETEEGRERMSKDIEDYGNAKKEEGKAEGRIEGEEKGRTEQAKKTAINLFKSGMTADQIASAVDYSIDQVKEWLDIK